MVIVLYVPEPQAPRAAGTSAAAGCGQNADPAAGSSGGEGGPCTLEVSLSFTPSLSW